MNSPYSRCLSRLGLLRLGLLRLGLLRLGLLRLGLLRLGLLRLAAIAFAIVTAAAGCAVNPVPTPGDEAPTAGQDDDGDLALKDAGFGADAAVADAGTSPAPQADALSNKNDDGGLDKDAGPPLATVVIAAIGDPHITGGNYTGEKMKRLVGAVDWLNANAKKKALRMVLVLGDLGWSGGLEHARVALDKLTVPYVPINGDNVMFAGDEKQFDDVFGPVYAKLQQQFPGMARAATPTYHPGLKQSTILENLAFDVDGVHVVVPDLNPRKKIGPFGEQGELHDYPGGTWPWLQAHLAGLKAPRKASVLLASHIPVAMSPGALTAADMVKVGALADKHPGVIAASLAGHYHIVTNVQTKDMKFPSMTVPAIWAGLLRVHIATATVFADRVQWHHEFVVVPGFVPPP